jgi:hypothetical protein
LFEIQQTSDSPKIGVNRQARGYPGGEWRRPPFLRCCVCPAGPQRLRHRDCLLAIHAAVKRCSADRRVCLAVAGQCADFWVLAWLSFSVVANLVRVCLALHRYQPAHRPTVGWHDDGGADRSCSHALSVHLPAFYAFALPSFASNLWIMLRADGGE